MSCKCFICNHPDRGEIENAILQMTSAATPEERVSLENIAEQFDLKGKDQYNQLKMHALFHMPLVTKHDLEVAAADLSDHFAEGAVVKETPESSTYTEGRMSMAQKLKLHEADMLTAVNHEYLVTLKAMGRRLNKLAHTSSIDDEDQEQTLKISKWMTKPMVDLYLGLGAEIRKNVATLAEVDRALNGPQDSAASGLAALASAIRNSGSDQT